MAKFEILLGSQEQDQDTPSYMTMALHENYSNVRYLSVDANDLTDFWPEGQNFGEAISGVLEAHDAGNTVPKSFVLHQI